MSGVVPACVRACKTCSDHFVLYFFTFSYFQDKNASELSACPNKLVV